MSDQNMHAVATKNINPAFEFKMGDTIARSWELECQGKIEAIETGQGEKIFYITCHGLDYCIPEYEAVLIER